MIDSGLFLTFWQLLPNMSYWGLMYGSKGSNGCSGIGLEYSDSCDLRVSGGR